MRKEQSRLIQRGMVVWNNPEEDEGVATGDWEVKLGFSEPLTMVIPQGESKVENGEDSEWVRKVDEICQVFRSVFC